MKRFNRNGMLFTFAVIFIMLGFGRSYYNSVSTEFASFFRSEQPLTDAFSDFTTNLDNILEKKVRYHDYLMNLDSVRENLIGTRVVTKPDTTVVKADSGSLIAPAQKIDEEEINKVAKLIYELQEAVEKSGAKFLYCAAPTKAMYESAPPNVNNYATDNMDVFLSELAHLGVRFLDLREALSEGGLEKKDIFYFTDHHWTSRSGFTATGGICKELNRLYNFEYNQQYLDIENYNCEIYHDRFLGSYGKKVGLWFTWKGADDFELIIPNFNTNLIEEHSASYGIRAGLFEDTVFFKDKFGKDYYNSNAYAAYSGGDYHMQVIKNNMNPDGKRILLVRDSFACVVAPFLALQAAELDVCDMRDTDFVIGNRLDIVDYLINNKPDYVLVLYSGISGLAGTQGKFDFFK